MSAIPLDYRSLGTILAEDEEPDQEYPSRGEWLPIPPKFDAGPSGPGRVEKLVARVWKGFQLWHPCDSKRLSDGIAPAWHGRPNGVQIMERLRIVRVDDDDDGEPIGRVGEMAGGAMVAILARHGITLGNPDIVPCRSCGWRHERDGGRCSWCGLDKRLVRRDDE